MVEIVNRQRQRRLNPTQWREFAETALAGITKAGKTVTLVFVSDDALKKLNRRFRGKNYATDVLSFPSGAQQFEDQKDLGEVIISVQRAAAQAKEHGLSFSVEVKQLILHGLLHLSGYDHEIDKGEMNRLELKLRQRLGIDE
jgi:probable rRNA maturation factor